MLEETSERRGFPGGLRAQFLLALMVLVVGTMALVALIGVHLAKREVEHSELARTAATARQLAQFRLFGSPDEILPVS